LLEHAKEITILLALLNITLAGGILIGRLWGSTKSAHHRIDSLETKLTTALEKTLSQAWRFCPLASKDVSYKEGGTT
jgi:hypothetical protein